MNQPEQDEAVTIDLSASSQLPPEMRAVHDFMKETYPGKSTDSALHVNHLLTYCLKTRSLREMSHIGKPYFCVVFCEGTRI